MFEEREIHIRRPSYHMNEMLWRAEQGGPWSFDDPLFLVLQGCTSSFRTKPSRCCVFLWLCCIRNLRSCIAACMRDWKGSGHSIHKRNILISAMVFVFAAFVHFSIQCKYLRKDVEQQSFINVSCLRRVKLTTPLARSSPGVVIPRWGVVKASAWDNHLKRHALRSGCRWVKLWKSLPSSCSDMLQWFCRGFSG